MLRRFTPSAISSTSNMLSCSFAPPSPLSSSSLISSSFFHLLARSYSSQSNGIDRKRARKYRSQSVLMSEEKRNEVDTAIAASDRNLVLNLRNEEEDDEWTKKQDGSEESSGSSNNRMMIPPASAWWADACVLRRNRESRHHAKAAVVGGEQNIQRIWKRLGITPRCLFVPDNIPVPEWAVPSSSSTSPPTVIVRAPGAEINNELLSAEKNDGFAAEFPLPARLPRDFALLSPEEQMDLQRERNPATTVTSSSSCLNLSRVVVAHGLRVPSNVGSIIKNARNAGYDAVILDRCCELTSEKVLRAAGEAAFDPAFHIFEFGHKLLGSTRIDGERDNATAWAEGVNSALLLKRIAASHGLLPMMLVPQTPYSSAETGDSYDAFAVAQQFHFASYKEDQRRAAANMSDEGGSKKLGAMLVVGGEAAGLGGLAADWNRDALHVPMLPVSVRMDNPQVNSINVAAAASVAMHLFRPRAGAEFAGYFRRGIVPPQSQDEESSDEMKNVPPLDSRELLSSLKEAMTLSSAGMISK